MKIEDNVINQLLKKAINMKIPESELFSITDEYELSNLQYSKICELLTMQGYDIVADTEIEELIVDSKVIETNQFTTIIDEFNKLELQNKYRCLVKLALNIAAEDEQTQKKITEDFINHIHNMNLQYSYIAVLLKAFFVKCNAMGKAELHNLIDYFDMFYQDRLNKGKISEKLDSILGKPGFSHGDIKRIILFNPLKRSFLAKYFEYDKNNEMVSINVVLWDMLSNSDKVDIIETCEEKLDYYYSKLQN